MPPHRRDRALLPDDFASTGLHARRRGDVAPVRFQVLGERCSGTNLVKRLLARNTPMRPTEALGWKHGFVQAVAVPADLAVICVVRNAADWALSVHRRPWHAVPPMQRLGFSEFIRAPWQSHVDRVQYFRNLPEGAVLGQPLQQDRDPLTGEGFACLFDLRRAKLAGLTGFLRRDCTAAILRLEDVQADQAGAIARLAQALDLPPHDAPFRPVTRRLGSTFVPAVNPRPSTPAELCPSDRAWMLSRLDLEQEARLGYSYA